MSDVTTQVDQSGEGEVQRLGYEQKLRREFGFFHAFAISFASVSIIVAFYGSFALALGAAGPAFFWGLLIVGVLQILVALVLAEVSSRYPVEGGIYQWTLEQTGATSGWFSAWAYWWTLVFTMASCAYAAASFLLPGLGFDSVSKYWVIFIAIVIVVIGLAINGIAQWILKVFVTILLFAEIVTTVVLALVFFFGYRVNPFSVLVHSFSQTHGSTINWVWFGFFGAIAFMGWTYLSFEVAGAAAEEVHEPARNVPRVIVGVTVLIVVIVTFVTMAFILAIPNIQDAMTGNIADPVIQTTAYHLGSGFEKPLLILISFGFAGSMVALHIGASRTLYAFGRDKMIPGSRIFTVLSERRRLPWVALSFTAAVTIVILLINLGAEKVFATLLLIAAAGFFVSYAFVDHLATGASREEAPFPRPLQPGSLELCHHGHCRGVDRLRDREPSVATRLLAALVSELGRDSRFSRLGNRGVHLLPPCSQASWACGRPSQGGDRRRRRLLGPTGRLRRGPGQIEPNV